MRRQEKQHLRKDVALKVHLGGAAGTVLFVLALSYVTMGSNITKISVLRQEQRDFRYLSSGVLQIHEPLATAERMLADRAERAEEPTRGDLAETLDVEGYFVSLTRSAAENHVLLRAVEAGQVQENAGGGYWEARIRIEAAASFSDFYRFLFSVISAPQGLTKLETLSVRQAHDSELCDVGIEVTLRALSPMNATRAEHGKE